MAAREIRIRAKGVRSLVWNGDELIDWAKGGTRLLIDITLITPMCYEFIKYLNWHDTEYLYWCSIKNW
jgi:hypothetical protein